ncbi:hypothetical protein PO909_000968 [Leuciscus waleckii]
MLPNLVVAGHYKYVSCLPHYLEAMRSLSKLAPNTYREFKDDGQVAQPPCLSQICPLTKVTQCVKETRQTTWLQ